jgi:hypothetical protein
MLRRLARARVVLDNPWESASFGGLLSSLKEVRDAQKKEPKEVRWAILFFEPAGKEMCAIFLASDGSVGIVQGVSLSVHGKLLAWAKAFIRDAFLTTSGPNGH